MSAEITGSRLAWGGDRDAEGHRTFFLETRVITTSTEDGPAIVMTTPGLPFIGAPWLFGNDIDAWAFCLPTMSVRIWKEKRGDPNKHWLVKQTFTTKPQNRCQDASIEDPLLEPDKLSGSFVRTTIEATQDKDGDTIESSSFEPIKGPAVEFDRHIPTVVVSQNVAVLGLETFSTFVDTVNDRPLWGMAARTIKMSGPTWERKYWGGCNIYYTRVFEFQVDSNTFDRDDILDKGLKALPGTWSGTGKAGDPFIWTPGGGEVKKENMVRFLDPADNPIETLLDGVGNPQLGADAEHIKIPMITDKGAVKHYPEKNFLLLGIPSELR